MNKSRFYIYILCFLLLSCANKYNTYSGQYQFSSENGQPAYDNLDFWAAHPWKWDPSDSIPAPLQNQVSDSLADVFFIHPTTFTAKKKASQANAAIDDASLNAKTDYSSILYQASVFNQHCRVFAPRYRQAHISNFYTTDSAKAAAAFELAYEDVKNAFLIYLSTWNKERPLIIAGHSQGAFLANRLLKEFFEDNTDHDQQEKLRKQLVAAYIIGWPVPKEYFTSLSMCDDSLETGCLVSWRTFRTGYIPGYLKNTNQKSNKLFKSSNAYVTNPLSWSTTGENISKKYNNGSVLTKFNKIYTHTTNARIDNSVLYVNKPKFPWSFLYFTKNYHIADINLFYINIRENLEQRLQAFLQ